MSTITYTISKCPCGDPICKDWHVNPVAALQGVHFTEEQAMMVAKLLNEMANTSKTTYQRN